MLVAILDHVLSAPAPHMRSHSQYLDTIRRRQEAGSQSETRTGFKIQNQDSHEDMNNMDLLSNEGSFGANDNEFMNELQGRLSDSESQLTLVFNSEAALAEGGIYLFYVFYIK